MDTDLSDSYLVVERMIREGSLTLPELQDLLTTLESQELISTSERAALLELAWAEKQEDAPAA